MAYLSQNQRDDLLNQIKDLKFNRIKGKVRRMDDDSRMVYFRNVQESGRWMTRYLLPNLGTRVTLVETMELGKKDRAKYTLVEIIVEPTADNRL